MAGMGRLAARITHDRTATDASGKYREIPTLPTALMLTQAQRDELSDHKSALEALCRYPAIIGGSGGAVLVALTKMMHVLPAARQNEASAEARGEAYLAVLDDVPPWAVDAAIRRWYRGDCGTTEHGELYNCAWAPAPCDLRRVALAELWRIRGRAHLVGDLLRAEQRIEFTDQHCAAMRARLSAIFPSSSSPVGKDGSGEATGVTPVERATVGHRSSASPA